MVTGHGAISSFEVIFISGTAGPASNSQELELHEILFRAARLDERKLDAVLCAGFAGL